MNPRSDEPALTAVNPADTSHRLLRLRRWLVSPDGLTIGVAGFLAGYWLMWNAELQFIWMVVTIFPGLWSHWRQALEDRMFQDPVLRIMTALIALTLGVGLIQNFPRADWNYRWEYLIGALAMPPVFAALWIVCRHGRAATLMKTCAWSGALAAAVSLVWWHEVQAVESPGARLHNPLVYGGLHPVATGIFGGFALVALALCYIRQRANRSGWKNAATLAALAAATLAVCLTISRGAYIAVLAGLAVITIMALLSLIWPSVAFTLRRTWPVLATITAVALVFFKDPSALLPIQVIPTVIDGKQAVQLETVSSDTLAELLARGDTGRFTFYRSGIAMLDTWPKRLTGVGLWEPDEQLERQTSGAANHFHSLPVATLVHSGAAGCLLLLAAIIPGLLRAWHLMQQGQGEWLVLLAFGFGGLIFDGQSACSLVTHPRFEALLLWVPLTAASAIAHRRRVPPGAECRGNWR